MPAILFGSISTVADTSELQRRAFHEAFAEHGLDWDWDRDSYLRMLETSGGQQRIAAYAESVGARVDAVAVHRSKSAAFQRLLRDSAPTPRPGVAETLRAARAEGTTVALVTTTSPGNVAALLDALGPELGAFDLVLDVDAVERPKPDRAVYDHALERLGEMPGGCVAIEDNLGGVDAAVASGVTCVAFPNQNTADHDFVQAARRISRVDLGELRTLARI